MTTGSNHPHPHPTFGPILTYQYFPEFLIFLRSGVINRGAVCFRLFGPIKAHYVQRGRLNTKRRRFFTDLLGLLREGVPTSACPHKKPRTRYWTGPRRVLGINKRARWYKVRPVRKRDVITTPCWPYVTHKKRLEVVVFCSFLLPAS